MIQDNTLPQSNRYQCYNLQALVNHLNFQSHEHKIQKISSIKAQRKTHLSCSQMNYANTKSYFNNKTKQGQLFDPIVRSVPYMFIPKYKNQTFIIPDRAFAKGKAGKRFNIKMKDTSVFSFRDCETQDIKTILHKNEKSKTVQGRKIEQLNRILDRDDGRCRASVMKSYLKTRKKFIPTSSKVSQTFSCFDPMLQPKDNEIIITKKTNLSRTFGSNKWRPASRGNETFKLSNTNSNRTMFEYKMSQCQSSMR